MGIDCGQPDDASAQPATEDAGFWADRPLLVSYFNPTDEGSDDSWGKRWFIRQSEYGNSTIVRAYYKPEARPEEETSALTVVVLCYYYVVIPGLLWWQGLPTIAAVLAGAFTVLVVHNMAPFVLGGICGTARQLLRRRDERKDQ